MAEFAFDLSKLTDALIVAPTAVNAGARTALGDIKRDWVREARDISPIDTSNLRVQIQSEVYNPGVNGYVEIVSSAKRGTFNYGYYIHEMDAGGKSVNGEKKYLDKSAETRLDDWKRWIEADIESELKGAGW